MRARSRTVRVLLLAALLGVLVMAAWYGAAAWADSGWFAVVLFGIPLLCTIGALWVEYGSRTLLAPAVVGALGAVSLGWALLTGLGIGLGFLPPSLLLLCAAAVSWIHRTERRSAVSGRR